MVKTGIGVDVHAFTEGSGLTLGGVPIPHDRSIAGHSDGDVVIHAIVDALLGAAAQGDIGVHFPSTDPRWQGADSRTFLRRARELVAETGGEISHVDCTVILQEPAIAPFVADMRRTIAVDLGMNLEQVSVKATTTDLLGFIGQGEGVAALAVATVEMEK